MVGGFCITCAVVCLNTCVIFIHTLVAQDSYFIVQHGFRRRKLQMPTLRCCGDGGIPNRRLRYTSNMHEREVELLGPPD